MTNENVANCDSTSAARETEIIKLNRKIAEMAGRESVLQSDLVLAHRQVDEAKKALNQLSGYAVCICEPDEHGNATYHRNCNRHMKPIIDTILQKLK